MTKTDLATFRELLRAKQIELSGKSLSLERIVIERSADELEEAEYKSLREMAIRGSESRIRNAPQHRTGSEANHRSELRCLRALRRRSQEAPSGGGALGPIRGRSVPGFSVYEP